MQGLEGGQEQHLNNKGCSRFGRQTWDGGAGSAHQRRSWGMHGLPKPGGELTYATWGDPSDDRQWRHVGDGLNLGDWLDQAENNLEIRLGFSIYGRSVDRSMCICASAGNAGCRRSKPGAQTRTRDASAATLL